MAQFSVTARQLRLTEWQALFKIPRGCMRAEHLYKSACRTESSRQRMGRKLAEVE